jgi:hypothetical protein
MHRDGVPEALSHKDAGWKNVAEPSFSGIGTTRLGVSCYPIAFLSNKVAYFVQFLKKN